MPIHSAVVAKLQAGIYGTKAFLWQLFYHGCILVEFAPLSRHARVLLLSLFPLDGNADSDGIDTARALFLFAAWRNLCRTVAHFALQRFRLSQDRSRNASATGMGRGGALRACLVAAYPAPLCPVGDDTGHSHFSSAARAVFILPAGTPGAVGDGDAVLSFAVSRAAGIYFPQFFLRPLPRDFSLVLGDVYGFRPDLRFCPYSAA